MYTSRLVYDDVCGKQASNGLEDRVLDAGERAEAGSEVRNNATNQAGRQGGVVRTTR